MKFFGNNDDIPGLAPNFWGELPDGRHVVDEMKKYGLGSISESKALTQNKGTLYRALAAVFENVSNGYFKIDILYVSSQL
jgi:hypothetical protein